MEQNNKNPVKLENSIKSQTEKPVLGHVPLPDMAREYGGRKGPEATRYGDWENNGKCVDF